MNPDDGAIVAKFYNDANAADYDEAISRARMQLRSK